MVLSAEQLRLARVRSRMKAYAVAEKAGITAGYYSELENGRKVITSDLAEKFASILSIQESDDPFFEDSVSALTHGRPCEAMRSARLAKGLSFADLSKKTRYPARILQTVEEGYGKGSERLLRSVAKALDLDPEILLDGSDETVVRDVTYGTVGATPPFQEIPGGPKPKYVPLISMSLAGTLRSTDFTDGAYTFEGVVAFDVKDHRAFAVTIRGDSMAPKFDDGDVAIVYPTWPPRSGGLVICRLNDEVGGGVMFKIYSTKDNGKTIVLSSYNPRFPDVDFSRESIAWIYPVAGVLKTLV